MFYLINKEKGISSFKAIRKFAKENGIKKVGHTGTLDPLATGLLLIATDDDTKLINYIDKGSKTYIATMRLGVKSDTLDIEGDLEEVGNVPLEGVEEAIMSFVKTYEQMPPNFSARKVNGKRAYELAREGKEVTLKPSMVTIDSITNIKNINKTDWMFEVSVSRGTYIRSLIKDIANQLGTEAIMTDLIRNKLSNYDVSEATKKISAKELINLKTIETENMKDLFDGKPVKVETNDGEYAVEYKNDIIGIVSVENNTITKRKLFGNKYERLSNESS